MTKKKQEVKKNRDALIKLMERYRIRISDVAELLDIEYITAKQYRVSSGRDITDNNLELLKYKLAEKISARLKGKSLAMSSRKFDPEKIKSSVDMAAVVGSYIDIKSNGNEFTACCPFHNEKTPSFSIVPAKNFMHCFGCGWNGDVIDFVTQYAGVTFQEACEALGGKELPEGKVLEPRKAKEKVDYYKDYRVVKTNNTITAGKPINLCNPKRDGKVWEKAKPSMVFDYGNGCYVLRLEIDGKKLTPQVRWTEGADWFGWTMYPFKEPRPLYNKKNLTDKSKQVLIVEGEKAADAARVASEDKVIVISWCGRIQWH